MQGGTKGSGSPKGNRNALKHDLYTAEARAGRKQLRDILSNSKALIESS
jgi:ribosomal protein L19E